MHYDTLLMGKWKSLAKGDLITSCTKGESELQITNIGEYFSHSCHASELFESLRSLKDNRSKQ